ncbi:hypothetical protein CHELA1G11_11982 [Hyphomicrobiales bacterium]|nr:hypothetical protein CHELA1G11_11982 [Hyphomicrobiales bacterium]CAH1664108.1 hypothetical protein CHELA1G2_12329 [Hyphomicrobiales bacterium]
MLFPSLIVHGAKAAFPIVMSMGAAAAPFNRTDLSNLIHWGLS